MLLQKGNREDAILALINTWLKDPTLHCGWCGETYNPLNPPCCEQPFIANNVQILKQFHKELRMDRELSANKYASTQGKNMRLALKFPPGLLTFLERSFLNLYNEKLFNEKYSVNWFAKKFYKYFAIPEEI